MGSVREGGLIVEVGGLFPAYLKRDCPACVRAHAAIAPTAVGAPPLNNNDGPSSQERWRAVVALAGWG